MKCTSGLPHPCRQCLACRVNARRIWAARIMLEAQYHEHSSFVTFTYAKEPADGSVVKEHLSSTFHRLRKILSLQGRRVRFFGVGEYGELGHRPHYHAAVFGCSLADQQRLESAWNGLRTTDGAEPGFVHVGSLSPDSAAYISGYVVKKLTAAASPSGRTPEFAVMSRRPGVGLVALPALVEALSTKAGAMFISQTGDVPVAFMVAGRLMPLGDYLRRRLRLVLFGEENTPARAKEINEQRFFQEHMPFVPPDASPTLRRLAQAFFSHEAKEAHSKYVESLKHRARDAQFKHEIRSSKRKL